LKQDVGLAKIIKGNFLCVPKVQSWYILPWFSSGVYELVSFLLLVAKEKLVSLSILVVQGLQGKAR